MIGNAAYRNAPLVNPRHDAQAMHGLLQSAGFTAELLLDASRQAMLAAIERFGRAALAGGELALFYFAGHGAQLDWRNYLLPVDAQIASSEALKNQCIDLGVVLDWLASARKAHPTQSFLIFLDACRDDPFGGSFRPSAKGLSQFDAPSGSLLAYATAPGATAADGEGNNGLYTGHLIRELGQTDVPLEAALKRVRLNVRLSSNGAQIPWESTSLEKEVFIMRDGSRLSEEDIERRLAAELEQWQRIKTSKRPEDWIDFLRAWPGGRFAEIAQTRLDRLLAEKATAATASSSIAPSAQTPPSATSANDSTVIPESSDDGQKVGIRIPPQVLAVMRQDNPYSAGRYPLGRRFSVDDVAVFRDSDILTGIEEGRRRLRVTRVDEENDRVEINGGRLLLDSLGNVVENQRFVALAPIAIYPAELQVGKRWTLAYLTQGKGQNKDMEFSNQMSARIDRREWVETPAGRFNAFVIETQGWSRTSRGQIELKFTYWVVPGLNFLVREERIRRNPRQLLETRRSELIAIRQQTTGL
ncbi:caspase family protein [Sulfuricystis multivorans]|uniref:caspase family protein n=1 Tax=Sulfuricystis multivorans TaxID=2211108 RepID=UPI001558750A|nr:caspase family protein [Sulfuricystis multivorans]